jgi:hypothetical protein
MSRIKSPIDDALQAATYNRLCSMVYAALDSGADSSEDPRAQLEEWRELGAYLLAEALVLSSASDWPRHPNTFWIDPWIAQHLRSQEASGLTYIVEQWLERRPLAPNVSDDPLEEDKKVKHLRQLIAALNR